MRVICINIVIIGSMFEEFKKIKIKGGCFDNETELELFKKDAISVIYGRNGSGKTTIAHCVGELIKTEDEKSVEFSVTSEAILPEDKKGSVYIFDEDFVREQVRVENDGINTIVMLGEQVELDNQISQKKQELSKKEKEYEDLLEKKRKYDSAEEVISPMYYFNQIRDALREDGGWADIDRDIKGNTMKSRITEDVINTLLGLEEPEESFDQLRNQVMADLTLYRESENAQAVAWTKATVSLPDDLESLGNMLKKNIDAPVLNEREHRLIQMLSEFPQHYTHETRQLINEGWKFCPLCLREIEEKDKSDIAQTLTRILNDEAEKYDKSLDNALMTYAKVDMELPVFSGDLNKRELNAAVNAQTTLNNILNQIREKISQRKRNIYEALEEPFNEELNKAYIKALAIWKNGQDELEKCVERFNDTVNKRVKLFNKVRIENNSLARKYLSTSLLGYKKALENRNNNQNDLEEKDKECRDVKGEIDALKAQKERTDIALNYINQELQYVFYSKRKVKLEPGDGCYLLKINGRKVKPKKMSVGERNVLGLCYFFAKLFGGKTDSAKYTSEYLIVIDDPVSSFDYGNRIGVMSLLRFQFGKIIMGNTNSRILVMSHDLRSVFDLVKIRNEVISNVRDGNKSFMELINNNLVVKTMKNEYKKLLEFVFSYAVNTDENDPDDSQEMSIGNIMRRMLEAFSSFCYNTSFEKMLRKEDVLASIPDNKKNYYGNFMYRLTLNTESHMEESLYSLNSTTSIITREEKVKTAKSVLLFLFYINKPHISAYLSEEQITEIEKWSMEEDEWIFSS